MNAAVYRNEAFEPEAQFEPQRNVLNSPGVYIPTVIITQQPLSNNIPTVSQVVPVSQQLVPNGQAIVIELPSPEQFHTVQEPKPTSTCCSIFKRLFSAFFIIGDAFMDWSSFEEMNSGLTETNVTNKELGFQMPNVQESWSRAYQLGSILKGGRDLDCNGKTMLLTVLYGLLMFIGSAYGLFQLINMVGETLFEINRPKKNEENGKKKWFRGFQILHGWTETFFALWLEDIPQGLILLFFSDSCHKDALNAVKATITVVVPFFKNTTRKVTSKQAQVHNLRDGCCIYRRRIGVCTMCCPQWTCYDWILCACCDEPIQKERVENGQVVTIMRRPNECTCCVCIPRVWGCRVNMPPVCTCCSITMCHQRGLCQSEDKFPVSECCKPRCHNCCFDEIAQDPVWIEKYIWLGQLIYMIIFVLYILVKFGGLDLMVMLTYVWSIIAGYVYAIFGYKN